MTETAFNYVGVTIIEPTLGGLFAVNPFALLSFAVLFTKRRLFPRGLTARRIALFCLVLAAAAIVADTEMAGILQRYQPDFAWYLLLGAALTALALCERLKKRPAFRYFLTALCLLTFASLAYQFFLVFNDYYHSLDVTDPLKFERVRVLFEFLN